MDAEAFVRQGTPEDRQRDSLQHLARKLQLVNVSLQHVDFDLVVEQTLQILCAMCFSRLGVLLLYFRDRSEDRTEQPVPSFCRSPQILAQIGDLLPHCSHFLVFSSGMLRKIEPTSDVESLRAALQEVLSSNTFLTTQMFSHLRPVGTLCLMVDSESFSSPRPSDLSDLLSQTAIALERAQMLHLLAQRHRAAEALRETVDDVSSCFDLQEVLTKIVERARKLLNADATYVSVKRNDGEDVYLRSSDGLRTDAYFTTTYRLDEGLGGLAARLKEPIVSHDYFADTRFVHLPKLDEVISNEGIIAMLAVPLLVRDTSIGTLFVNHRQHTKFSEDDIHLAASLGKSAALAIEKARLYENEKLAIDNLRRLNGLVTSRMDALSKSIDVQDSLVDKLMEGLGTESIAVTLADLVNCPVLVEDHLFRSLTSVFPKAYAASEPEAPSPPSLRQVISDPSIAHQVAALAGARHPVRIEESLPDGKTARVVTPIIAGRDLLGYLSVIDTAGSLGQLGFLMMERAATVLALEMAKQKAALDVEDRLSGSLLDDLLESKLENRDAMLRRAERKGLNVQNPRFVVAVSLDCTPGDLDYEALSSRMSSAPERLLLDLARAASSHRFRDPLVTTHNGIVLLLLPAPVAVTTDTTLSLAEGVLNEINANPWGISAQAGVGRVCHDIAEYALSFKEALQSLAARKWVPCRRGVQAFDQLGLARLFLGAEDNSRLSSFVDDVLKPLIQYDAQHNSNLVLTAFTYFEHNGHPQAVANALHIHVNTLTYRLQRIGEICHLNLENPEDRLSLQVALTIIRATGGWQNDGKPTPPRPYRALDQAM